MNNEEKYIDLLLNKCIKKNSKTLFISYDLCNKDFINKLVDKAKLKYNNILLDENDYKLEYNILNDLNIEEIINHSYYKDKKDKWDESAINLYDMLMVQSCFPRYFDKLNENKKLIRLDLNTKIREKYMKAVGKDLISWTIFALPNEIWAEELFPNDPNKYKLLKNIIYKFSMIDTNNPVISWNKYIKTEQKKCEYLNNLNIEKIILTNKLGTDLTISLIDNYIFRSLENNHCIENLPTYSIWTTPNKYKVDGIVYTSVPIVQNSIEITNAWFKFNNGNLIDYDADKDKWFLDKFFSKGEEYKRLGEIALIDYNSPIAKTKTTYNCNLFNENISTHLAFGNAYQNTIKNGINMNEEELDKIGCNICKGHLDFSIGTTDLSIKVITKDNKIIEIFNNGNFNYDIINDVSPFE